MGSELGVLAAPPPGGEGAAGEGWHLTLAHWAAHPPRGNRGSGWCREALQGAEEEPALPAPLSKSRVTDPGSHLGGQTPDPLSPAGTCQCHQSWDTQYPEPFNQTQPGQTEGVNRHHTWWVTVGPAGTAWPLPHGTKPLSAQNKCTWAQGASKMGVNTSPWQRRGA